MSNYFTIDVTNEGKKIRSIVGFYGKDDVRDYLKRYQKRKAYGYKEGTLTASFINTRGRKVKLTGRPEG